MPHPSIHHIVRKKELHKRNIQTNKTNFHHMFRITGLVSLARHAHDDHHFVQMGLFGKGEYPRHLGVPTPPKQEAASDTSMKRSSPNHTGEKCNLPLLFQKDCNTTGSCKHEAIPSEPQLGRPTCYFVSAYCSCLPCSSISSPIIQQARGDNKASCKSRLDSPRTAAFDQRVRHN